MCAELYKNRPEWADVTPVPQDDGGRRIVKIAYSPQFVDANDYMRAVLLKDERSERALDVTSTVLLLNPANYTVWEYRRRILESVSSDLKQELKFVSSLIDEHPKNYQLWHHRQWLIRKLAGEQHGITSDPWALRELDFTASVISDDSKNYHGWQYRRWVVNYFKMPVAGELQYTKALITEDMYNNSAWNHRFVVVTRDEGLTPDVLKREIEFVQNSIRTAPNNESAWNYFYGLLVPAPTITAGSQQRTNSPSSAGRSDADHGDPSQDACQKSPPVRLITLPPPVANLRLMRNFAEDLAAKDMVAADSSALLGFLVEVYTDCLQVRIAQHTGGKNTEQPAAETVDTQSKSVEPTGLVGEVRAEGEALASEEESISDLLELALSTCDRLATEVDRIRANYWRYRARQLTSLASEAGLDS
ncbi:unnamed protein product [Calicophoron daubneyi]|uniref:Protein farnesyltransferase/geranylgeranyltransferase type-1 subunit alpha n=1 Tax=Calicophoron daubneyi TaxID=300641 RepID=A0AAV2TEK5_CALDB